jgi:hypothetical protein
MANYTDVTVKNMFRDSVSINAKRMVQGNTHDVDVDIEKDNAELVHLPSPETALKIQAPGGINLRDCFIKVKSSVDLEIVHSRTLSNWTLKIIPSQLPPDTPTSTNVIVGQDEPD